MDATVTEAVKTPITLVERDIKMTDGEARLLLLLIRKRQDECKKVTPEFKTHATYAALEIELEHLKMKIARQL